ncbi:MAG: virulence protein [Clostridia bacterium]|nr:virulence protein [Clostridia bacterium]
MTVTNTTIKINAQGAERKRLVLTIAKWLGCEAKYLGAPSFAYEVDYFTIDKNGSLTFDSRADSEVIERLLEHLYDEGFDIDQSASEEEAEPEDTTGVVISIPMAEFTETSLKNLLDLVEAKSNLICKAFNLGIANFDLEGDALKFNWLPADPTPEEIKAYSHFISALCKMAKTQKRINAKEKEVDNEKYAFRCFLLRLGFIGEEFKAERKILLRNLTGSSAFKNPAEKEVG